MERRGLRALGGDRRVRVAGIAVAACLAVALAVTGVAEAAYRRSFEGDRTLAQRLADARTARCLVRWSGRYATREFVMAKWLGGRDLLDAGDYSGAVEQLRLAYRSDVGDRVLLALFQKAQEIEASATNRKAHLQHGHEGPGSTLRPQDVER